MSDRKRHRSVLTSTRLIHPQHNRKEPRLQRMPSARCNLSDSDRATPSTTTWRVTPEVPQTRPPSSPSCLRGPQHCMPTAMNRGSTAVLQPESLTSSVQSAVPTYFLTTFG